MILYILNSWEYFKLWLTPVKFKLPELKYVELNTYRKLNRKH